MEPAYRYRARAHRVIDGDTFVADIDLGFEVWTRKSLRLRDYDAIELRDAGGLEHRERLLGLVAGPLIVVSHKDRQSFARWVCDVYMENGRSIVEVLRELDRVGA